MFLRNFNRINVSSKIAVVFASEFWDKMVPPDLEMEMIRKRRRGENKLKDRFSNVKYSFIDLVVSSLDNLWW